VLAAEVEVIGADAAQWNAGDFARGRDNRETAATRGTDDDVAVLLDLQRVKSYLFHAQIGEDALASFDDTRRFHIEGQQLAALQRDIERAAVWGETDSIGPIQRENNFADFRTVGFCPVHTAQVAIARTALAEIGKPESTGRIEHEVIRSAQDVSVHLRVER